MRWLVALATLAIYLALLSGCRQGRQEDAYPPPPQAQQPGPLVGKRVLIVLPEKNFRAEVYDAVREAVTRAGGQLVVCSLTTGTVRGTNGHTAQATVAAEDVNAQDYAAVVFGGGPGIVRFVSEPSLVDLADRSYHAGKVVAAIRIAQEILAHADLLRGTRVAGAEGSDSELRAAGAEVTSQSVEVDGRIITARGREAANEFAQRLVEVLGATTQ